MSYIYIYTYLTSLGPRTFKSEMYHYLTCSNFFKLSQSQIIHLLRAEKDSDYE